jgi:hypothetical protein
VSNDWEKIHNFPLGLKRPGRPRSPAPACQLVQNKLRKACASTFDKLGVCVEKKGADNQKNMQNGTEEVSIWCLYFV